MQYVYVENGAVAGLCVIPGHQTGAVPSGPVGSTEYTVDDSVSVGIGWGCVVTNGVPEFTAPAAKIPLLTPMQFYLAFTPTERIAIKPSTDPMVQEFWATYQLAAQTNHDIDPNLVSVQEALTYMATAKTATPPGAGILASTSRIQQILAGIPQ